MKKIYAPFLLLLIANFSYATNYYVAANGNDSNTGTSPTAAWQTLAKVSSISNTLTAGDSVFFRRGDVFIGTLEIKKPAQGNATTYIYYGAYGVGANPIFKGSKPYTTWSPSTLGAGIWETNTATGEVVTSLFSGDSKLPISRFPKTGVALTPSALPDQFTLISPTINRPFGYWLRCRVVFRASKYAWFERVITYSNGDTIKFSVAASWDDFTQSAGWGFYIEGKAQEINLENEWAIDTTAKKLYLKTSQNPNLLTIDGAFIPNGIELPNGTPQRRYITIQGIDFIRYAVYGISSIQNRDLNILNCGFYDNYSMGIWYRLPSGGASNMRIENCTFQRSRWAAFQLHNTFTAQIKNNVITDIQYGRAMDFVGAFNLLYNNTIERNVIKNVGGYGISFYGGPFYITKNIIDSTAYMISDAGAIMCYQSGNGTIIEDNFVSNTGIGVLGIPTIFPNYGIYLDEDSYNITLRRNTIYNSHNGLLFNNGCKNMVVRENTFFNNAINQIQVQRVTVNGDTGKIHENMNFKKNIFFANSNLQRTLVVNVTYPFLDKLDLDSNYHINPFSKDYVLWAYTALPNATNLSMHRVGKMNTITTLNGQESNGKTLNFNWNYLKNITVTGANMIPNSQFTANASNWSEFPAGVISHDVNSLMGPALRIEPPQDRHIVFTTPSGSMSAPLNQAYRFRFKHYSTNNDATIRFTIYNNLTGGVGFPSRHLRMSTSVKEDTIYAVVTREVLQGRFQFDAFKSNGTCWLDDVYMEPITADTTELKNAAQIFTNPSDTLLTLSLNGKTYFDLDSNFICQDSITLQPWSSKILIEQMFNNSIHPAPNPTPITQNQVNNCAWYSFEQENKRLVDIHPHSNNLGNVIVHTYNSAPITTPTRKLMGRRWKITTTNTPTSNVTVRLYFTQNNFNSLKNEVINLNNVSELVLFKYSGANEDGDWNNNTPSGTVEIQNVNFVPYQNGYYAEFDVNSFSEFWLSHDTTISTPLPLRLLDFKATAKYSETQLNWTVQGSYPNYFEVEKSIDSKVWKRIGIVESGNSVNNSQTSYEFTDKKTVKGLQYYRLHMKDDTNLWSYSPIRTVYFGDELGNMQVFPNPVQDELIITVNNISSNVAIRIITPSGQQVYQGNMNGNTTQTISLSHLKAGVYFVQLQTEQTLSVRPIVKMD